jgi:hypothetical protein
MIFFLNLFIAGASGNGIGIWQSGSMPFLVTSTT